MYECFNGVRRKGKMCTCPGNQFKTNFWSVQALGAQLAGALELWPDAADLASKKKRRDFSRSLALDITA